MHRGFTLVELIVTLAVAAAMSALVAPRFAGVLDRFATDAAARDVSTALVLTRHVAVSSGRRARLLIGADSLRIDRWDGNGWMPHRRWPGPRIHGVALGVSNPQIVYSPNGIAWGMSNTTVVLVRGSQKETITTSRVGRVKRW